MDGGRESEPDYYAVLEIAPGARPQVVDAAYRQLVKDYHPDLHSADATAAPRMKLLNQAHAVLSDAGRRREYDRRHGFPVPGAAPQPKRTNASGDVTSGVDLPTLVVEPAVVELRPTTRDGYLKFSVRVRRAPGPKWQRGRHRIEIGFDEPWQPSMFTMIRPRGTEPPLDIDFELRLADLSPKDRHAGTIRVEARLVAGAGS